MAKFRKKPVVIEAVQIHDEQQAAREGCCVGGPDCPKAGIVGCWPHIHTLEGDHTLTLGDWLITGVKGERYFCKPDIFEVTYEPEAQ